MKFSDLSDVNMQLYLTLTDIPLFARTKEEGKALEEEINRRETDDAVAKAAKLVREGKLDYSEAMTYALDHLGEGFDRHFNDVLTEHEDKIDAEKYLLIGAYRNIRMLEMLQNPENFKKFPPLERFVGYRKYYARTILQIADMLKDTDVRIDFDVTDKDSEYGFWNDITQEYESIHFGIEDLLHEVETNPYIDEALEAEVKVDEETEKKLSGGIAYDPSSSDPFRLSGDTSMERILSIKAVNNQFLRVKKAKDDKRYKVIPGQLSLPGLSEHLVDSERERMRIIDGALQNNGVNIVGEKVYLTYQHREFEISKKELNDIKDGLRIEMGNVEKETRYRQTYTENDLVEYISIMDIIYSIPGFSKNDRVYDSLYKALDNIKLKADKDPKFKELLEEYTKGYIALMESKLNYDNAAGVAAKAALKKNEDEAIHKKYKEIEDANKNKVMVLYARGLVDLNYLREIGFLSGYYSNGEIMDYLKDGVIDVRQAREFIYFSHNTDPQKSESDYIKELYTSIRGEKDRRIRDTYSRKYFELLTGKETLELYSEGIVGSKELFRKNITQEDVLRCKKEVIVSILSALEKELPRGIMPTEEQLIELYGRKFSGRDIIDFVNLGRVSDEKVLELYSSRKSIEFLDEDSEMAFKDKEVLDFYSADRLLKMMSEGKINKRFVENYNNELIGKLSKRKQKEHFKNMVSRIKEIDEEKGLDTHYLLKLAEMSELGLIPKDAIKDEFDLEKLEELYFDEKITESDIVKFYNSDIVENEVLSEMLSDNEIETEVVDGNLSVRALSALSRDRDEVIKRLYDKENISLKDIMRLFLLEKDSIDAHELDYIFKGKDLEELHLVDLIPDDITEEKVEDLVKTSLISEDELSVLAARGLVSPEKQKELTEFINSASKYEEIFGQERKIAKLTERTENDGREPREKSLGGSEDPRKKVLKIDPDLQRKFMRLMGADSRELHLSGIDNTLDGYTVYGFKEYGLMVFAKFDQPNNSTYVTTVGQGTYFLKVMERSLDRRSDTVTIESDATKAALRETEHVKPKNACKNWGKRMLDAMKALSPRLTEKVKGDKSYQERIKKLTEEISKDYEERL